MLNSVALSQGFCLGHLSQQGCAKDGIAHFRGVAESILSLTDASVGFQLLQAVGCVGSRWLRSCVCVYRR